MTDAPALMCGGPQDCREITVPLVAGRPPVQADFPSWNAGREIMEVYGFTGLQAPDGLYLYSYVGDGPGSQQEEEWY